MDDESYDDFSSCFFPNELSEEAIEEIMSLLDWGLAGPEDDSNIPFLTREEIATLMHEEDIPELKILKCIKSALNDLRISVLNTGMPLGIQSYTSGVYTNLKNQKSLNNKWIACLDCALIMARFILNPCV